MKAIQVTRFGDPSVLTLTDLPDPRPGPGQVSIDVTHAAVGLIDLYIRQGLYQDREGLPQPPYVPGLEVAGTVRALGEGVTGFRVGEQVVALSGRGSGGYASVYVRDQAFVISTEGRGIDPAIAVAVVPNAIMAHVALTRVARLGPADTVLVQGALGAFASAFPGVAKHLGATRVVGSVRSRQSAARTRLPYDDLVESTDLAGALGGEKFDVIIDPVGGAVRTQSMDLLKPFGRMLLVGNASGDWEHAIGSNGIWYGNLVVAGFNAGGHLPAHPELIGPAAEAALATVAGGLADVDVEVLPLAEAATAHQRMEDHSTGGRLVLAVQ